MATLTVVEDFDVIKDYSPGLFTTAKPEIIEALCLDGTEEALHHGIVITVALAAHAANHFLRAQELPVILRCVLL